MNNLRRLYNKNRKEIWRIIIIIAFSLIILQLFNYILKETREKKEEEIKNMKIESLNIDTGKDNNINLTTQQSVVSGEKLSTKKLNKEVGTITNFLNDLNNEKIEEAYNMLTDECKEEMYSNIEEFNTFYYSDIFEEGRVSFEIENWIESTYKISIIPDILSTGKNNNGKVKQDYITVVNKDGNYMLNINNYIGRTEIKKEKEQEGIILTINYKDTYMDYEYYDITAKNKSYNIVQLDILQQDETMYIEDKDGTKYFAYSHELLEEMLKMEKMEKRNFKIRYYSRYTSSKQIKKIVFSQVSIFCEERTKRCTNRNKSIGEKYGKKDK